MKLSILIRSIKSREPLLKELLIHLYKQMDFMNAEILYLIDNKEVSSGEKANKLLQMAKGEYIVFIDDDDWVADNYISEMLKGCDSGADCLGIRGFYSINGGNQIKWRLSKNNTDMDTYENGELVLLRHTNHITAVKRSIAIEAGFPDKSNAEDKWYSSRLKLETEYTIEHPMYWYRYSSFNKEYA